MSSDDDIDDLGNAEASSPSDMAEGDTLDWPSEPLPELSKREQRLAKRTREEDWIFSDGGIVSHNGAAMGLGNALLCFVLVGVSALNILSLNDSPEGSSLAAVWAVILVAEALILATGVLCFWLERRHEQDGSGFPAFYPWVAMAAVFGVWIISVKVISGL
ncbi:MULTISPECIES: hypothetical protein [unclassified Actinobaculum]|uniref:hypothetical protein n=1 Tax=unclassified Actinobaculum TaxID=2609299 RepID=UPI000D5263DC|nr:MULTISPECIES: hypothetical protein [unclassified Actinobaculum]AWE41472.1 hypothetical protein DDD63_00365 [Actinobaculum sp. 313]RTE48181.1 hypothetical protein EKN07_10615 [Actinobaculum sp. 352]